MWMAFVAAMVALALAVGTIPAHAQTFTDLHDFNASAGDPYNFNVSKLTQGRDGNFYAESNSGGTGNGIVAKMTPSGTVSVILSFDGNRRLQRTRWHDPRDRRQSLRGYLERRHF